MEYLGLHHMFTMQAVKQHHVVVLLMLGFWNASQISG